MLRITNLFIMYFIFTTTAHAQIVFQDLGHSGTGCPQGTVAMSTSPDRTSVSFLFDEFSVTVPQTQGENDNETSDRRRTRFDRNYEHKSCALSFTAEIPVGQKVEALEIEVYNRGAAIFDQGVSGKLGTIFVGHNGNGNGNGRGHGGRPIMVEQKIWDANNESINEDWISNKKISVHISSNCSRHNQKKIRFDLKSYIEAEIINRALSGTGLITMDSSDVNGNLKVKLITRSCGGRMSPR